MWKDKIPVALLEKENDDVLLLVVTREEGSSSQDGMCIRMEALPFQASSLPYNKDTINQAVIDVLMELPEAEIGFNSDEQKFIHLQHLKNTVARQTRRGVGNKTILVDGGEILFYSNTESKIFDSVLKDTPLVVCRHKGKYGIIKNPNFEQYGFVVKYKKLS